MENQKFTITRRLNNVFDEFKEEFRFICNRSSLEEEVKKLEGAGNCSNRPSILAELYIMLDSCDISYKKDQDSRYYKNIVDAAYIPAFFEIENKMIDALYSKYESYPSPQTYMKRIVDKMTRAQPDNWEKDSLRLRILKQFIKYGDCLLGAGFRGQKVIWNYVKDKTGKKPGREDVLLVLDDGIFDYLEAPDTTKAQRKPDGKYGLLKAADDLAAGKFRTGGGTKKVLYLFAMVYGMTYYSGGPDEIQDYESDVEKNLFRDYYGNNLMRFLLEHYREQKYEFEIDPSGRGINYKNFAEMIYVYFISKDYSPREKIEKSSEMIKRVQEKAVKINPEQDGGADRKGTAYFRRLFSEDILEYSEKEFEEFICKNYDCDTRKGGGNNSIGVLQLGTEQETAYKGYKKILADIEQEGFSLGDCNYGLWFTDVKAFQKKGREAEGGKQDEFLELLKAADNFLRDAIKGSNIQDADSVTRTSVLAAYYYYFNILHEKKDEEKLKTFGELFEEFAVGVNPLLIDSGYQELNSRNIFDVLVVFSAYAYLYI